MDVSRSKSHIFPHETRHQRRLEHLCVVTRVCRRHLVVRRYHSSPATQTGCESFPGVSMPIERWAIISRNGEAGWCGRRKHRVVSHGESLFLLGGYTSAGVIGAGHGTGANLNDVWKSTEGAVRFRVLRSTGFLRACWYRRCMSCSL